MSGPRSGPRPRALLTLRSLVLIVVALLLGVVVGALTFVTAKHLAPAILAGFAAAGLSLKELHQLVE